MRGQHRYQWDAEYWRSRANSSRVYADETGYPEARRIMLRLAAQYEDLANDIDKERRRSSRAQKH